MASPASARIRRQIRGFVLVWTGITLLMGACTFAAIYAAYGALSSTNRTGATALNNAALPASTAPTRPAGAVVIPTNTPLPTRAPTEPPTAEVVAQAVTEEEEEATRVPPTPVPTPLPVDVDRFELGIQVQVSYDLMNMWLDVVDDQLELNWVKMQVRWEDFEAEQDQYDWTYTDIYLPSAAERGLKVLVSVVTAPDWARESGVSTDRHGPPADPNDYADFVGKLLERYPGMIHAVEVWNEQNLDREWTSARGLSAQNYVTLLRVAHEKIKSIDPGIIVVSGALSPTGLSDGIRAWDDFTYTEQMIQAGALNYMDCFGAHHNGINVSPDYTYDQVPNDPTARFRGPFDNRHHSWSFRSTLQGYADRIARAGGEQKLCVTEFGWPSMEDLEGAPRSGFEFALDNSLEEQRDYTIAAVNNMIDWDIVRLAFVWNLNYGPQAGWDPQNDNTAYSIIGPNTTFRPVFDAIREFQEDYETQFDD